MDTAEFRRRGKEMIDFVADYIENIRDRPVFPDVAPGYLRKLIPDAAPQTAEPWEAVFQDIERVIMPGITHWHSPKFHAYYPTANSWPAILADILSDSLGVIGFSWASSPACTELETVMMDWLAKLVGLPERFLFSSGTGGGVIQGTASEACYVALMAAKKEAIRKTKELSPWMKEEDIWARLVCYESEQAHSAADSASQLAYVKYRHLPTDQDLSLRGATLAKAIQEDRARGLIPFYVLATLGTTPTCAFDNLEEIGKVCSDNELWLHVDAAYAGSAFVCPEFRSYLKGVEYADSYNFNPHKWLLVNFDCSALWLRDSSLLVDAFTVDTPIMLNQPPNQERIPDYRHWQIALGRRFRSLKLWFVMRLHGAEGLQNHIRTHVKLAHEVEALVRADDRFEVAVPVRLGLVCFRLKPGNAATETLLRNLNDTREIHLTHATVGDVYMIRFSICSAQTNSEDIRRSWNLIQKEADALLRDDTFR